MGEIVRTSKEDKVPSLSITVELDDGARLDPEQQFLYLHEVDETVTSD